jgi:hypothetical protein
MIPSIKIFINSKPYLTDSISVEVANVAVDTLKQMYDIKDIVPVKGSIGDWWKYLYNGTDYWNWDSSVLVC